jgi:hypothetical protein
MPPPAGPDIFRSRHRPRLLANIENCVRARRRSTAAADVERALDKTGEFC